jgi:hypothetical protein
MACPVAVNISTSKFTISGTVSAVSGNIYSVIWDFGDGSGSAPGSSATYTYSAVGTYTIYISYKDGKQDEYAVIKTVTIKTGNELEFTKTDAFSDKPLYLSPECSGDVRITAEITKLNDTLNYNTRPDNSAWTASINFATGNTGIPIAASSTIDLYVDAGEFEVHPSDDWIVATDKKIENLKYIPAFYTQGNIVITARIMETDDVNDNFDINCGLQWQFPTYPDWYEGTMTYTSSIMRNLIISNAKESYIPATSPGVANDFQFVIKSFGGMPPIELKDTLDYNKDTSGQTVINRACLSTPQFFFQLKNNLAYSVTLSNVSISFNFTYNETDLLMNTRSEGSKPRELNYLFTLPKGNEDTRMSGLNYPLFGVIDGFKIDEVIRVFGYYNKWDDTNSVYYPTCLTLLPIVSSIGTDHPAVLYKSYIDVADAPTRGITLQDYERLAYKGNSDDGDYCKVLTPQILASDDHYRTINVRCKQSLIETDILLGDKQSYIYGASCDSSDTIFELNTAINTSIDEEMYASDLTTYIEKIRFFNCEYAFATSVDIPREEISPVFREKLYTTYKNAPILQSTLGEPLYFVNFTINDYGEYFPISHGQTLEFSDSLSHAPIDGVRSSDIFIYSNTNPNVFGIISPEKYKYKVKFNYSYDIYQDAFTIEAKDLTVRSTILSGM